MSTEKNPLQLSLQKKLKKREQENSLRKLTLTKNLVDFFSNDYLGFARSEELYKLIQNKVNHLIHQNGATGSRLLSGNDPYTEKVEATLAKLFRAESCLLFNSGYSANLAILSSIPQRGDTILYDELIHASIKDGARLGLASRISFKHNNHGDLEAKLNRATGNIFVVIESVYSMDGDSPDINAIINLCNQYNAALIVDEAHGVGVGGKGLGMVIENKFENEVPIRIYTFGKALGVHGACVCGSKTLTNYLINFARPFIYTTALPPHAVASIDCAFELLLKSESLISILESNISHYNKLIQKSEFKENFTTNSSPIQTIIIPGNEKIKNISEALSDLGFDVKPILSPTIKEGTERLRICIHAFNTHQQIEELVNSISGLVKDEPRSNFRA